MKHMTWIVLIGVISFAVLGGVALAAESNADENVSKATDETLASMRDDSMDPFMMEEMGLGGAAENMVSTPEAMPMTPAEERTANEIL